MRTKAPYEASQSLQSKKHQEVFTMTRGRVKLHVGLNPLTQNHYHNPGHQRSKPDLPDRGPVAKTDIPHIARVALFVRRLDHLQCHHIISVRVFRFPYLVRDARFAEEEIRQKRK